MAMKTVNLVPASRRDAKRSQGHRLRCAIACGAYGLLLCCGLGAAHLLWGGQTAELSEQLASTENEIRRLEHLASDTRSQLATARATLEANRTVAEQPDWSVLMVLLSKMIGDDVVLRSVAVTPPPPTATAKPGDKTSTDIVLELSGIGQNQLAVQRHVLRLEETGLFSNVSLLDTGRETYLNGNAIAFRLQCVFGDPRIPASSAPKLGVTSVNVGGIVR